MSLEIRVDHHLDQLLEGHLRPPPELLRRFRRIGDEKVDFGRPEELRILLHIVAIVEANVTERGFAEIAHRARVPRADDVVVGVVLLEHSPHRVDVVAGIPPVASRVEVAEFQLGRLAEFDPGDGVRDFSGDKLESASRALVVEQNPRDGV